MKKSLFFAVGRQKLFILELQTVLFEAANLMGTHPTHPDDGCYLSPNEMLLGKSAGESIVLANERNKLQAEVGGKSAKWILEELANVVHV